MTRIWSGRQIDQVYAGMAERLVRQSNNARLDPSVGVNPRVRRILARMHRAGLLENMAGLWLPDMYTADGDNRVERMGGLTARGALEQGSVGSRPTLTRDDERSNLLLQSIWPGSGDEPTGWSVESGGNGSLEAGTDGNQDYLFSGSDSLTQNVSVLNGKEYLIAVRVESAASSESEVVSASGVALSVIGSNRDMGQASAGDWLWLAVETEAVGTMTVEVNGDTGDRLSRPALHYLPEGWLGLTEEARQAWLSGHYAASEALREYAGSPEGLSGIHFDGQGDQTFEDITGLEFDPNGGMTLFLRGRSHRLHTGTVSRWMTCDNATNRSFGWNINGLMAWRWRDNTSSNYATPNSAGHESDVWRTWSMTAEAGQPLRLYRDAELFGSSGSTLPSILANPGAFSINRSSVNSTISAVGVAKEAFTPEQNAALHEILTETP